MRINRNEELKIRNKQVGNYTNIYFIYNIGHFVKTKFTIYKNACLPVEACILDMKDTWLISISKCRGHNVYRGLFLEAKHFNCWVMKMFIFLTFFIDVIITQE